MLTFDLYKLQDSTQRRALTIDLNDGWDLEISIEIKASLVSLCSVTPMQQDFKLWL